MQKFFTILPLAVLFSVTACAPLSDKEQKVETQIPILKYGEPEKASSQAIPDGSKVFVIYAQENAKSTNVSISSNVVVTDGSVYIGSSCSGCSSSHLSYRIFQGEIERQLINRGLKPTFANLINNEQLYMNSRIMLDRVASLGKSVNAPYTLLVRDAYIGYGSGITWVRARGCNQIYAHPLIANIEAILLNNSTGEILTSFTYKMTNMEDSYNSKPATLYQYSRYKYYDYVEQRGFNFPTTDWPSCRYGVEHEPVQFDNLCWGESNNGCIIPDNTFKAYRSKLISELVKSL